MIPLLNRRDRLTLMRVLRLWSIVLPANLVGALTFARRRLHAMFDPAFAAMLGAS